MCSLNSTYLQTRYFETRGTVSIRTSLEHLESSPLDSRRLSSYADEDTAVYPSICSVSPVT